MLVLKQFAAFWAYWGLTFLLWSLPLIVGDYFIMGQPYYELMVLWQGVMEGNAFYDLIYAVREELYNE